MHCWWECKVANTLANSLVIPYNNPTCNYHTARQLHSWAFSPETWKTVFIKKKKRKNRTPKQNITFVQMFIVTLFLTAPNQELPTRPWAGEWLNKQWCGHTLEYYSAITKNGAAATPNNLLVSPGNLPRVEKAIPKRLGTDFRCITFLKWEK